MVSLFVFVLMFNRVCNVLVCLVMLLVLVNSVWVVLLLLRIDNRLSVVSCRLCLLLLFVLGIKVLVFMVLNIGFKFVDRCVVNWLCRVWCWLWIVCGFGVLFILNRICVSLFVDGRLSVRVWNVGLSVLLRNMVCSVLR